MINSDCKSAALQCSQGYCVKNCVTSQDCKDGARCIIISTAGPGGAGGAGGAAGAGGAGDAVASDPTATATGTVCQALEKMTCALNSECSPLKCGKDLQCRNECKTAVDCNTGNVCTVSGVCVDLTSAADSKTYDPTTNDVYIPGSAGASGGGKSGSGTSGTGGHGGAGGKSGGTAAACPTTPQTIFGGIAQGDANPFFTNGTGVRTATQLLIFSSYVGPASGDTGAGGAGGASDAGVPVNMVYVQAFDPDVAVQGSWKSAGPAAALFPGPEGTNFQVANASIAPTGEIALMLGTGPVGGNWDSLYAAFLTTGGAGAASVKYVKTVPIESAQLGDLGATWSPASQTFVLSWIYFTPSGLWLAKVQKFLPNGNAAGGASSVTIAGVLNGPPYGIGVGSSGTFVGVVYREGATTGFPYLSVLDGDGNIVGAPTALASVNQGAAYVQVAGTAAGFVTLYPSGGFANEVFAPATDGVVSLPAPVDGGDAGMFTGFSFHSTATYAQMISDDEAGAGGVGAVLLEPDGASFLYVSADGSKHYAVGTVVSSAKGTWVAITNHHGSFGVSLYEGATHVTRVVASGCM